MDIFQKWIFVISGYFPKGEIPKSGNFVKGEIPKNGYFQKLGILRAILKSMVFMGLSSNEIEAESKLYSALNYKIQLFA